MGKPHVLANTVDHRHAISEGGNPSPGHDGLASYCPACHSAKTARGTEAGAVRSNKPRRGCDVYGFPLSRAHHWNKLEDHVARLQVFLLVTALTGCSQGSDSVEPAADTASSSPVVTEEALSMSEPEMQLVPVPAKHIAIECNGTYESRYEDLEDSFQNRDDRDDKSSTVFVIVDDEERILQYVAEQEGFAEFCTNCKKDFSKSMIRWSSTTSDRADEYGLSNISGSYGNIDRLRGTAEDNLDMTMYRNGSLINRHKMSWKYRECLPVSLDNIPSAKPKF